MHTVIEKWQDALVLLAPGALLAWLAGFGGDLATAASFFGLHLAVYMIHQIEEHLWPGGFRQFTNRWVFQSGEENFPVDKRGVALVNIGWVWLPIGAAALWPDKLYMIGAAWFGLSLVNGLMHIASSIRFRVYNPGLVTSILGLLPLSILFFANQYASGTLSMAGIAGYILAGVVLHAPVAALFVIPFRQSRTRPA